MKRIGADTNAKYVWFQCAEGYSNTMIASRLNLSDNTVKSYVESLLTHLNARNRAEAVAAASRLKLI